MNDLKASGINAFLIDLANQKTIDEQFFKSEILFINIPFRRDLENPYDYVKQLEIVAKAVKNSLVRRVFFASSTSVYPQNISEAREEILFEADNERSRALLAAENLFQNQKEFQGVVLRLSGLCGYDRQIGKFLSGKTNLKDGGAPVNLVHRDDCVEMIVRLVQDENISGIFNICCDGHPAKKELYIRASQKLGLKPPTFENDQTGGKIVSNQKIKQVLNYTFKYPDPFDFV